MIDLKSRLRQPKQSRESLRPDRIGARRRRRWLVIGISAVVAALAVPATLYIRHVIDTCGDGVSVSAIDQQCIGVTDGSYVFEPEYADIEQKIATANAAAVASGRAVTVALLEPFTVDPSAALNTDQVRNALEGGYTAQWRANNTAAVGDARPMVRLVLANEGSAEQDWQSVTSQLDGMVNDPAPLVAVAGLGVSFPQTVSAAQDLSAHGLPTVGAIVTADDIDFAHIHGFIRVEPDDQQFVTSLRGYLAAHPALNSTLIVYDNNSDDGSDLYTESLRSDLQNMIVPTMPHFDALGFTGVSVPSDSNKDMFNYITTSICAVGPKLVLYSGRLVDLRSFLLSLESRECKNQPLTVASGGTDLSQLNNPTTVAQLRAGNVSVVYASPDDALGWTAQDPGTPPHFTDFRNAFTGLGLDASHLITGDAIAAHDAVLTAAKAIRLAYSAEPGSDPALPKPPDVLTQLLNLNDKSEVVPAAGGDLSFSYQGAETGDPEGKPIPVLRIPSDGTTDDQQYTTPG